MDLTNLRLLQQNPSWGGGDQLACSNIVPPSMEQPQPHHPQFPFHDNQTVWNEFQHHHHQLQTQTTSCDVGSSNNIVNQQQVVEVITASGADQDHHQQHQDEEEEEEEEELGAVKEMMFKIAAMQPVEIDPASIRKPKRRNVRISDDPQSVAARLRRERISEKIRILQRLVPGGTKLDTASMLDEAIRYVKFLKRQIRHLQLHHHHHPPPPHPPSAAANWTSSAAPTFLSADDLISLNNHHHQVI